MISLIKPTYHWEEFYRLLLTSTNADETLFPIGEGKNNIKLTQYTMTQHQVLTKNTTKTQQRNNPSRLS